MARSKQDEDENKANQRFKLLEQHQKSDFVSFYEANPGGLDSETRRKKMIELLKMTA